MLQITFQCLRCPIRIVSENYSLACLTKLCGTKTVINEGSPEGKVVDLERKTGMVVVAGRLDTLEHYLVVDLNLNRRKRTAVIKNHLITDLNRNAIRKVMPSS